MIRQATLADLKPIYSLYQKVISANPNNLMQGIDEISISYVQEMLNNGLKRGLILLLEKDSSLIGYLKAFTSPYRRCAHVLTNTTMMIDPQWQNQGYGSQLMNAYLTEIKTNLRHIYRFEVLPFASNQKAINFYVKHGFVMENSSRDKIRNIKGNFESEMIMAWFNPKFSPEMLEKYHLFLQNFQ